MHMAEKNTYTEKKTCFFVVITGQVTKHASYSGIVGSCPNQSQREDGSLHDLNDYRKHKVIVYYMISKEYFHIEYHCNF